MKEKKLKNIIKEVLNEVREYDRLDRLVKSPTYTADWVEYDNEVSDKLKNMVLNLLNYKDNHNININEYSLSISTNDISNIKKNNSNKLPSNEDDYLSVEIIKETGFSINKGYSLRTQYIDNKIYDEILPLATAKLREINNNNFSNIWDVVMKESGLMRDNNIDELLKNIDV